MKIPLGWLRDYVPLPESVPMLVERLTLAGLEVAGVRMIGLPVPEGLHVKGEDVGPVWHRDKIVVAKVLNVDRHPNADRLTIATLDYGANEPKTVVTGAPNIRVGESGKKVVLGLTGSVLFDGHSDVKKMMELKPSKIRGVPSDSMVCSAFELGITDEKKDSDGIIFLEDDAQVGMPLADYMGDIVLEVDVLPNMARCLSMIGIAREVAALTGSQVCLPDTNMVGTGASIIGKVKVDIEDSNLCARYLAALIEGVKVGPSPELIGRRLTYAGMRPISNIVDITNYVMLEWGQPLHAFDYDKLVERAGGKAPTIIIRSARAGEKMKTLDGQDRELAPENLMIADSKGPIAIAGVMGGFETEVSAETKNILLEAANFNFISVRKTMKSHNLPSEASARFSKGIHPETVLPAARRACELMRQHAGGTVAKEEVDAYPAPLASQIIDLDLEEVKRILGIDITAKEVATILASLQFQVEPKDSQTLRVTTPPHRLDIQEGSADLIEEIARIHGYDRLPATLLADRLPDQHGSTELDREERVRDLLVTLGLQEVMNYALTQPEREAALTMNGHYVRLKNPISVERSVMRRSVLASVLETASHNLRHTEDVRLFEIGTAYIPFDTGLPFEQLRLAIVLSGHRRIEFWGESAKQPAPELDFFDLKGIVEAIVEDLHVPNVSYRTLSAEHLHPGRCAELMIGAEPMGEFGHLHPKRAEAFGMAGRVILVADFDLQSILAAVPDRYKYTPVPRFPAALRDIAIVVEEDMTAERIGAEIRAAGGDLLRGVRLFDLYRGESITEGKKSLAYALTYQADDRTLTDKEVDKAHKKIEDRLKHVLRAAIRGKD